MPERPAVLQRAELGRFTPNNHRVSRRHQEKNACNRLGGPSLPPPHFSDKAREVFK